MRNLIIILTFITLFVSCAYEKGGITDEMKNGLISFEQQTVGYSETKNNADGKIIKNRNNGILTLTYITEETGCPHFEGGYKIADKTLTLYYQDVNFQLVKCIDLFELEYKIEDKNLDYEKIKVERLKPIKKGLSFRE